MGHDVHALQREIIEAMTAGATVDQVDEELIVPTSLSDDHKAALWLFAWSLMDHAAQRAEVSWQLRELTQRSG